MIRVLLQFAFVAQRYVFPFSMLIRVVHMQRWLIHVESIPFTVYCVINPTINSFFY